MCGMGWAGGWVKFRAVSTCSSNSGHSLAHAKLRGKRRWALLLERWKHWPGAQKHEI